MIHSRLVLPAALCGLLASLPLQAHHSFQAEYDGDKPVTLSGTVVKWELINPHGWITLDAKESDGTVARWMIETGNPNALIRAGWRKDSLKPGDTVSVNAFRAKDGSHTANGRSVTLANGQRIFAGSSADSEKI